jgi:hypothetical protein
MHYYVFTKAGNVVVAAGSNGESSQLGRFLASLCHQFNNDAANANTANTAHVHTSSSSSPPSPSRLPASSAAAHDAPGDDVSCVAFHSRLVYYKAGGVAIVAAVLDNAHNDDNAVASTHGDEAAIFVAPPSPLTTCIDERAASAVAGETICTFARRAVRRGVAETEANASLAAACTSVALDCATILDEAMRRDTAQTQRDAQLRLDGGDKKMNNDVVDVLIATFRRDVVDDILARAALLVQ